MRNTLHYNFKKVFSFCFWPPLGWTMFEFYYDRLIQKRCIKSIWNVGVHQNNSNFRLPLYKFTCDVVLCIIITQAVCSYTTCIDFLNMCSRLSLERLFLQAVSMRWKQFCVPFYSGLSDFVSSRFVRYVAMPSDTLGCMHLNLPHGWTHSLQSQYRFLPTSPGILINSVSRNSHQKEKICRVCL